MNIAEILKDVPKGTKLYSPICGECELKGISQNDEFGTSIILEDKGCFMFDVNDDGTYHLGGECLLFPSKENRDWSTFKVMPEFKKGDFVVSENGAIAILNGEKTESGVDWVVCAVTNYGTFEKNFNINTKRYATEEEKQKLLKAIDENGYIWDEEKLELRKKIKKLKLIPNKYYTAVADCFHDGVRLLKIGHTYKGSDQAGCVVGEEGRLFIDWHDGIASSYLRYATLEEINGFEESRHKTHQFKPFDKVLARDNDFEVWFPADYGFYFEEYKPSAHILSGGRAVKYVIPYEGNEHLLGTSKNTK